MIQIGPFVLPIAPLLLAAALTVSILVGRRMAFAQRNEVGTALYNMMLAGVLAARLAFVVYYWNLYRPNPVGMLDIRDGGFFPWPGGAAAAVVALVYLAHGRIPRRAMLWVLAAGVLTLAIGGAGIAMLRHPVADGLPTQIFNRLDGTPLRLDTLRGKPVVVNLWASWCPPCRHEMPALQRAQASNGDVVFVFANQGETATDATQYLSAQHLAIANVILDIQRDIARQFDAKGLPTTLFFDRKGVLVDVRTGELSAASLAPRLEAARKHIGR